MSKRKQKYYVVWAGAKPGIYTSWAECQLQIKGFPGAKYKSFTSEAEAEEAYLSGYSFSPSKKKQTTKSSKSISSTEKKRILWDSLSVDAACSGSPGIMEYRGVWTNDAVQIFHQGPFPLATNNIGEFLALVHGIAFLKKQRLLAMPIYSDSRTALSWLRNKKVKTTLIKNTKTKEVHELVNRALHWLTNNTYENPILKWETEKWGEIPADFGRK